MESQTHLGVGRLIKRIQFRGLSNSVSHASQGTLALAYPLKLNLHLCKIFSKLDSGTAAWLVVVPG